MASEAMPLMTVFTGWDSHQEALVKALAPLTPEQLAWRPAPTMRSVGEIAGHIVGGRIDWFERMKAPGSAELASQISARHQDPHGNKYVQADTLAGKATELVRLLDASWQMIERTLTEWTVADLAVTYTHTWRGDTYAISRQWTIWRIMCHDIHHGGELAVMLGIQGIPIPELGDAGGHLTPTPLAE